MTRRKTWSIRKTRAIPLPIWSRHDTGPRVLVETTCFVKRDVLATILTRNGYSVRTCGGPEASDERCPLADHEECTRVAGADVIVHSMRHSDPRNREVLLEIQRRYPDVPLVVEVPKPIVAKYPGDFEACRVVPQPITRSTLLEAVDEVLRG